MYGVTFIWRFQTLHPIIVHLCTHNYLNIFTICTARNIVRTQKRKLHFCNKFVPSSILNLTIIMRASSTHICFFSFQRYPFKHHTAYAGMINDHWKQSQMGLNKITWNPVKWREHIAITTFQYSSILSTDVQAINSIEITIYCYHSKLCIMWTIRCMCVVFT